MNSIATRSTGTLQRKAPELFEGHCPDETTDVYSFGVVIYEVATGRMPYAGVPDEAIMVSKLDGREPCRFGGIPNEWRFQEELHRLARSCISRGSEDRPTMEDVSRQLAAFAAGKPKRKG